MSDHNPPTGAPTPNSAEWHWATARGFDPKAPHWDTLPPEIQTAVERVVHNITYAAHQAAGMAVDKAIELTRTQAFAEVRAMVEATPLPRDPTGMGISVDASDFKSAVLAGLAKLEGP